MSARAMEIRQRGGGRVPFTGQGDRDARRQMAEEYRQMILRKWGKH